MSQMIDSANETRRRQYLALMGIQPWYAKVAFANAKPSPRYQMLPGMQRDAPESEALAAPVTGAEPVASKLDASRTHSPARERRRALRPGRSAAQPPSPVRQPLHYRCIDPSLAVLAQDTWAGDAGNAAASCELLRNILKALGKTFDGEPGVKTEFPAAPATGNDVGGSDSLENLCHRDKCSNLLIFAHNGNELFPGITPSTTDFPRQFGGTEVRVTVTHGLREMLAFPELKRHCWQTLQPLRRRIER